jgi:hypothetical protein
MRFLTLVLTILALQVQGQYFPDGKRDYNWCTGRINTGSIFGGINLIFSEQNVTINYTDYEISFHNTNVSVSDYDGKLLFLSNGFQVANKLGQIMPNGDSLSYGSYYNVNIGNQIPDGSLILPIPGSDSNFIIMHELAESNILMPYLPVTQLLYSTIDIELDNGLGDVISKNIMIIPDTLDWGGLTACRHGNGRDWWIIAPKAYYDCYYILLLNTSGLHYYSLKCFSEERVRDRPQQRCSCFSNNGNYYITTYGSHTFEDSKGDLFTFDRCNGTLVKMDEFIIPPSGTRFVCISPNSRFVYITTNANIYKGDIISQDFSESIHLLDSIDEFSDTLIPNITPTFCQPKLAPDGKIYINNHPCNFYSTIKDPDLPDTLCNLQQHSMIFLRDITSGMPNFPNFRLGRLVGSECDTISAMGVLDQDGGLPFQIQVNGNPVQEELEK